MSRVDEILKEKGMIVLDGAMGSELERRGYDVNDVLWSAKMLKEAPEAIQKIHYDYLKAGADLLTCASYQASLDGFKIAGYTEEEAIAMIARSMELLIAAREQWWEEEGKDSGRPYPIVAGDVGPYGAYMADGSEYTGFYNLTDEEYRAFHMPRMQILKDAGAEFMVNETIPRLDEAIACAKMCEELGLDYWVSFTFKDGKHISEGKTIEEVTAAFKELKEKGEVPHLKALGVNCTPPEFIKEIVEGFKAGSDIPIVVYPNAGGTYDGIKKIWYGSADTRTFGQMAAEWKEAGATFIGGCCRTGENDIKAIAALVK